MGCCLIRLVSLLVKSCTVKIQPSSAGEGLNGGGQDAEHNGELAMSDLLS